MRNPIRGREGFTKCYGNFHTFVFLFKYKELCAVNFFLLKHKKKFPLQIETFPPSLRPSLIVKVAAIRTKLD